MFAMIVSIKNKTGENKMIVKTQFDTDSHLDTDGHNHYNLTVETSNTSVNMVNNSKNFSADETYITITLSDGRQMTINQIGGHVIMPNGNKVLID